MTEQRLKCVFFTPEELECVLTHMMRRAVACYDNLEDASKVQDENGVLYWQLQAAKADDVIDKLRNEPDWPQHLVNLYNEIQYTEDRRKVK